MKGTSHATIPRRRGNGFSYNSLHMVAKEGSFKDFVKLLSKLEKEAEVHEFDSSGDSSDAQYAAEDPPVVETKDNRGRSMLHYAVEGGKLPTIKFLVEQRKAPINQPDGLGWTPLHIACTTGNLEVLTYLLSLPNVDVNSVTLEKSTALHHLVSSVLYF